MNLKPGTICDWRYGGVTQRVQIIDGPRGSSDDPMKFYAVELLDSPTVRIQLAEGSELTERPATSKP